MTTMTGTCTTEQFWSEVARIGWGTKTTDIGVIKRGLVDRWDGQFMRTFQKLYDKLEGELFERVDTWCRENDYSTECGDDGFGDLVSHVVGLGQESHEEGMRNPKGVANRGRASDYVEKFSYSLPNPPRGDGLSYGEALQKARTEHGHCPENGTKQDHELFLRMEAYEIMLGDKCYQEPGYYAAWAKRDIGDLEGLAASEYGDLFKDLPFVIDTLRKIVDGDLSVMSSDLAVAVKRLRKERETFRQETIEKLNVVDPRGWSIDNLVGDALKNGMTRPS